MRTFRLLLALPPLLLAASAAAQATTTVEKIRGKDERGRYKIVWVRLADGFGDPAARDRVNEDLEREARLHICDPEPDPERRRYQEARFEMEVTYLSPRLLAVSTAMELYCGGAAHGPGALLYDLRTGARIDLEAEMADPMGFRRFVAQRAMDAVPADAGECLPVSTLEQFTKTGYIYELRKRSLTAMQDFPQVMMACAYSTEIAYADMMRFVKPGSPLRSLSERQARRR